MTYSKIYLYMPHTLTFYPMWGVLYGEQRRESLATWRPHKVYFFPPYQNFFFICHVFLKEGDKLWGGWSLTAMPKLPLLWASESFSNIDVFLDEKSFHLVSEPHPAGDSE